MQIHRIIPPLPMDRPFIPHPNIQQQIDIAREQMTFHPPREYRENNFYHDRDRLFAQDSFRRF